VPHIDNIFGGFPGVGWYRRNWTLANWVKWKLCRIDKLFKCLLEELTVICKLA